MLTFHIPGLGNITLNHLVLDFNGTLAVDGTLIPGVHERIERLSRDVTVHVVTADTFGTVQETLKDIPCSVHILGKERQDLAKCHFVENLGANITAAVGNGRNDGLMLEKAALGMAVIMAEGASAATFMAADLVFTRITDALDILLNPLRLTATLRT